VIAANSKQRAEYSSDRTRRYTATTYLPVEVSFTDAERALFLDDLRVIRVEVESVARALLARF
jgi:hypothetical protein